MFLKLKSVVLFFKILKKKTRKIAFLAGLLGWAPMKKWEIFGMLPLDCNNICLTLSFSFLSFFRLFNCLLF